MIKDYTKGEIFWPLIKYTVPLFLAIFLQAMYGSVDLFIVGQFNSSEAVSAVSSGGQFNLVISSLIIGLTMGSTIMISKLIGQRKIDKISDLIGTTIGLFLLIAAVLTGLILLNIDLIIELMNVPLEAIDLTDDYLRITGIGIIFVILYNVISSIFRGLGNSKVPLLLVMIACVINIVFDYILIGYYNMGPSGAAIATVFAQFVSVLIGFIILMMNKTALKFNLSKINLKIKNIKSIVTLGMPLALQDGFTQLSFLILISLVNTFGLHASSGVGIAEKVVFFLLMVPISFMNSVSAFVSQNYGANDTYRIKKVLKYGIISSFVITIPIFLFTFFSPESLISLFSNEPMDIELGASFLKATSIEAVVIAISMPILGLYNGLSKSKLVLIQGLIATFVFRIPLSFIFTNLENTNLTILGLTAPLAALASFVMTLAFYPKIKKDFKL